MTCWIDRSWIRDDISIIYKGDEYDKDYLIEKASGIRLHFRQRGLQQGDTIVSKVACASPDYIAFLFACFEHGIRLVGVPHVHAFRNRYWQDIFRSLSVRHVIGMDELRTVRRTPIHFEPTPTPVIGVYFTGGTTSNPKIIQHTHGLVRLAAELSARFYSANSSNGFSSVHNINHFGVLTTTVLPQLRFGRRLFLYDDDDKHELDTALQFLWQRPRIRAKRVITGGSAMQLEFVQDAAIGDVIFDVYGATELITPCLYGIYDRSSLFCESGNFGLFPYSFQELTYEVHDGRLVSVVAADERRFVPDEIRASTKGFRVLGRGNPLHDSLRNCVAGGHVVPLGEKAILVVGKRDPSLDWHRLELYIDFVYDIVYCHDVAKYFNGLKFSNVLFKEDYLNNPGAFESIRDELFRSRQVRYR